MVLLSTNLACSNPPRDGGPTGDTTSVTAATGETGGPPPSIRADCAPTDNALRFLCSVNSDEPHGVRIRWQRADGRGPERVREDSLASTAHDVLLWYLEPDADYDVVVEEIDGDGVASGAFHTGELPDEADTALDVVGTSSVPLIGVNDPCTAHSYAVIFDTTSGEPVWYELLDPYGSLGLLNMLAFTEDHTVVGQTSTRVVEVDLGGALLYDLDYGVDYTELLHHDVFERDGYYWLLFQDFGEPVLDGFLVYDGARQRVAEWHARDHLPIPSDAHGDWMHTNTIFVDETRQVYLSSYGQSAVLKVDGDWEGASFGALAWSMVGVPTSELPQDWTIDWGGVGGADTFEHQHVVHLQDDGSMTMLDNAHGRGLRLSLDQDARHASVVSAWPTGEPDCGPQGTMAVASTGGVFVGCSGSDVREYRPDGALVWQATARCAGFPEAVRFTPLEGW